MHVEHQLDGLKWLKLKFWCISVTVGEHMAPQSILIYYPFMKDFYSKAHVTVGDQWEDLLLLQSYFVIDDIWDNSRGAMNFSYFCIFHCLPLTSYEKLSFN